MGDVRGDGVRSRGRSVRSVHCSLSVDLSVVVVGVTVTLSVGVVVVLLMLMHSTCLVGRSSALSSLRATLVGGSAGLAGPTAAPSSLGAASLVGVLTM